MDSSKRNIYLATGAAAILAAGAMGYYVLILKKDRNKDQSKVEPSPTPPPQTPNEEEKKKAAAAFISQKLNSNEDFQKFSKNVGLDVTKDIDKNDENKESIDEVELPCPTTPNLLTESVCQELQIEPSNNSISNKKEEGEDEVENSLKLNSSQDTLELENTTLSTKVVEENKSSDKSRSISPAKILVEDDDDNAEELESPRVSHNTTCCSRDRSSASSPVPCECLTNWQDEKSTSPEPQHPIKSADLSRSASPEKPAEKSRSSSPEKSSVKSRSPSPAKSVKSNKSRSASPEKLAEKSQSAGNSRSASPEKPSEDSRSSSPAELVNDDSDKSQSSSSESADSVKSRSTSPDTTSEKSSEISRSVSQATEEQKTVKSRSVSPDKSRSTSPEANSKSDN